MLLTIYNLDDSSGEPVCSFGPGEHVVGRGPPLQCMDKRISRKHVQLEVSKNAATITAKHQINPCFYRAAEGNHISILKYESPYRLNTGDTFGFFPDKYWFQIKLTTPIENEEVASTADKENKQDNCTPQNDTVSTGDHVAGPSNENNGNRLNVEDAIVKVEEIVEGDEGSLDEDEGTNATVMVIPCPETSLNDGIDDVSEELGQSIHSANTDILEDGDLSVENMQTDCDNSDPPPQNPTSEQVADPDYDTVRVKQEVMDEEEEDTFDPAIATTSTATTATGSNTRKVYRDRCWYGGNCYRKNDSHRLNFSHPNDNDYDTDPEDARPSCPFGGICYRRNKDHRNDFKHSRSLNPAVPPPPPPGKKKRKSPTKTRKRKTKKTTDDDPEGDFGDGLTQTNIVNSKRRRNNKKLTESPLDDYDLNDPFIDDSGDEFQLDSDDDSDSDEDSQNK